MSEKPPPIEQKNGNDMTVIYYQNEARQSILFGFFRIPPSMDLGREVEEFRRQKPKGMDLSSWLAHRGAEGATEIDKQYREEAQKDAIPGREGIMPICIDTSETQAKPYMLEW